MALAFELTVDKFPLWKLVQHDSQSWTLLVVINQLLDAGEEESLPYSVVALPVRVQSLNVEVLYCSHCPKILRCKSAECYPSWCSKKFSPQYFLPEKKTNSAWKMPFFRQKMRLMLFFRLKSAKFFEISLKPYIFS